VRMVEFNVRSLHGLPFKRTGPMGPSIYDVHTEGAGVRPMWTGEGDEVHVDVHTENLKKFDLRVKIKKFYEKNKKGHQKFWQMRYRKSGRIPKIRKPSKKRGKFLDKDR